MQSGAVVIMFVVALVGLVSMTVFSSCIAGNQVSCPFKSRRVLSYDYQLLSRDNLTASSADLTSPVHYLVSRSNSPVRVWCTVPGAGTTHHVNLSFSVPVVVEFVISAGFSNGYVTNFSIEYSPDWESNFTLYHDPHIQQYFLVPHIDIVFALDKPLVAHRLQLLIHDGVVSPSSRLCWHLTFLGCLLSDLTDSTAKPASPNAAQTTLSPQPSSPPSFCPPNSQGHSVGLVLGSVVSVTVLLMVTVLVTVLTCSLCLRQGYSQWRWRRPATTAHVHTAQRENELNKESHTRVCLTGSTGCGSDASPYEVPLTSPTRLRRDSLVDNPMYSLPYEHLQHCKGTVLRIPMVFNKSYVVTGASGESAHMATGSGVPRSYSMCLDLAGTTAMHESVH